MGAFGPDSDFGWDFGEDLGSEVGGLEIEGPLELRAVGEGDELELRLPALNFTHGYVRRILVGDGITIKVEVAQKITLFHPHDIGLSLERCLVKTKLESNQFRPLGLDSCAPLLSVQVEGSPLIVALNTRNPEAHIKTVFHTDYTIELLSEKRYNNGKFKEVPSWASGSLKSKFLIIEKALKDLLGSNMLRGGPVRLLKAKITSSNLVKFRLEVERDITENDRIWSRVEEWRTKPVVERIWFEMVARVEAGKGWKKMLVRKLTRPVRAVESSSWSNLMSNISFTEIPSIVLPPEALTLDANW
ncbi:uncharacterized protein LOC109834253 [Asparagus officinalis]|nr:uncharacterized protein LOC109834253 [Asparagus officinalis]